MRTSLERAAFEPPDRTNAWDEIRKMELYKTFYVLNISKQKSGGRCCIWIAIKCMICFFVNCCWCGALEISEVKIECNFVSRLFFSMNICCWYAKITYLQCKPVRLLIHMLILMESYFGRFCWHSYIIGYEIVYC